MRGRIFYWSLTSALAGFLFGFDTVVISGAEQKIQALWGLSRDPRHRHGGCPLRHSARLPPRRLAHRPVRPQSHPPWDRHFLRHLGVGCAFAWDVTSFIAARFIGGIGIGVSTVAAPLYISEIAPPAHRGSLAGMFQFNIVFGIVIAFASNALLSGIGENAWRWMLGVAAFPSVIYTADVPGPSRKSAVAADSQRGSRSRAARARLIEPEATPRGIAKPLPTKSSLQPPEQRSATHFWSAKLRVPILLAFLVAFFNQLSGINAILYFAPRIFELTGPWAHRPRCSNPLASASPTSSSPLLASG